MDDEDVFTYGIEMPDMDSRFGTCGAMEDGKVCRSSTVVARVAVETREVDYNEGPQYRPVWLGYEVMVEVCEKHRENVISQVVLRRKDEADRIAARDEVEARLAKARAEVEQIEAELHRL